MILTFTVSVDVGGTGEKWVPYIKNLLLGRLFRSAFVTTVQYEGWMNKKDSYYETIEKDADDRGMLQW